MLQTIEVEIDTQGACAVWAAAGLCLQAAPC